jgi:hypothetical protein
MSDKVAERKDFAYEKEICCNPAIHIFTGERKKTWMFLCRPRVKHVTFLQKY